MEIQMLEEGNQVQEKPAEAVVRNRQPRSKALLVVLGAP